VELEGLGEVAEAAAALASPLGPDGTSHDDPFRNVVEVEVHVDGVDDPGCGGGKALDGLGQVDVTAGPGMAEQVSDVDSEAGHGVGLSRSGV
jgi:hypothetical protein